MEEKGSFGGVEPYWKNKRPLELELEGNQKNDDDELSNTLIMNEGIISSLPLWKKAHLMDYFGGGSSSNIGAPTKAFNTTTTINNSSTNTLFSALINENQGPRADEFLSFCNTKESLENRANDIQFRYGHNIDPNMDPRKIKRIISNRASAQRSRWKKIQYISDMENTVRALKSQISSLSPRVALYTKEHQLLQLEHNKLTHQISVYTNQELLGQVEFEKNKAEVNRLRVLYFKQQQQQQLHIQQQYHHYFQAPSLPHHEEYLSMNQVMPNYFNNQPTQIFPHYPNLDVEFGCNNINGATGNYNLIQDQSTRSQMVSNTTLQYDVDDSDHVQDQTGQSWTTTTTNFIEEPKQHDHDIETDIQFYNNHFGSIPEYA